MSMQAATEVSKEANKNPVPSKGFLINRNFRLLAIGQAISNMGDFVYSTTLLIWVYVLTHSAAAVSGVLIAQYVPVFLLGPIAGVFVDRWNRRQTMVVSDVIRAIIALLPLVVPIFLRLPAIYTSVFLISVFSRFFMPASSLSERTKQRSRQLLQRCAPITAEAGATRRSTVANRTRSVMMCRLGCKHAVALALRPE